jgi:peptidyl-tRNA hydrolase
MNPAMYIFLNKGLNMSTGKAAAQASHAAVEAFAASCGRRYNAPNGRAQFEETNVVRHWYKGGHYTKLVMEARDTEQLRSIETYLHHRGFKAVLIIDEGHTEGTEFVPTALGIEIVDKDNPHVASTFSEFKTYRPEEAKRSVKERTKENLRGITARLHRGKARRP